MKKILLTLIFAFLCSVPAYAQSTNVVTGYIATSGCPGNPAPSSCFIQFGANGGGGATNATIVAPIAGSGSVKTLDDNSAAALTNQATQITALNNIVTNTAAPLASQSPAVPVGGISICDGANGTTNPCTTAATIKPVSTAPVTATDKALVVDLRPDSPGIITFGQATKANSVPVTIASDQYVDPCQSPNIAKSSVAISITSATTTSLVPVSGSTVVYVCGFSFTISPSATSADTAALEYGTGAACTSPTLLTGTFGNGDLTTAAPPVLIHYGGAGQTVMKSAASAGICIVTAGTTINTQGVLTYVQQ